MDKYFTPKQWKPFASQFHTWFVNHFWITPKQACLLWGDEEVETQKVLWWYSNDYARENQ